MARFNVSDSGITVQTGDLDAVADIISKVTGQETGDLGPMNDINNRALAFEKTMDIGPADARKLVLSGMGGDIDNDVGLQGIDIGGLGANLSMPNGVSGQDQGR